MFRKVGEGEMMVQRKECLDRGRKEIGGEQVTNWRYIVQETAMVSKNNLKIAMVAIGKRSQATMSYLRCNQGVLFQSLILQHMRKKTLNST